jgi:TonB family protein
MEQHKTDPLEIKRYAHDLADLYKIANRSQEARSIENKFLPNEGREILLSPEQSAALTKERSAAQKKLNEATNNFSNGHYRDAQKCLVEALLYLEKNKETMSSALAAAQYDLLLAEDKQNIKPELAKYLPSVVEFYLHNGWKSSIDYGPYIADLDKEVKSYWNPPHIAKASKRTLLHFKISRFGDFSDVKIESSSGLIPLDDAAIQALEKVGHTKPLPDGSPDSVDVQFHFDYNVHHHGENGGTGDW